MHVFSHVTYNNMSRDHELNTRWRIWAGELKDPQYPLAICSLRQNGFWADRYTAGRSNMTLADLEMLNPDFLEGGNMYFLEPLWKYVFPPSRKSAIGISRSARVI